MKRIFEIHFSAHDKDSVCARKLEELLKEHMERKSWLEVYDITDKFKLIEKENKEE